MKGKTEGEKGMTEVVAALIWNGNKFLACQRPANKARGLLWEFVGGKVEPGETKSVSFEITPSHLELLDSNMNRTVEPGEFEIRIGASSEDIRLRKTIRLS